MPKYQAFLQPSLHRGLSFSGIKRAERCYASLKEEVMILPRDKILGQPSQNQKLEIPDLQDVSINQSMPLVVANRF